MTTNVGVKLDCDVFANWECSVETISTWQSLQSSEKSEEIKRLRADYEKLASEVAKKSHESKQYTLKIERSYSSATVKDLETKVKHLRFIVDGLHKLVHYHHGRATQAKAAQVALWTDVTEWAVEFSRRQKYTYLQLVSYTSEEVTVECKASNGLCKLCVPFPSMTSLLHGIDSNAKPTTSGGVTGDQQSASPPLNLAKQKPTRQSSDSSADHTSEYAVGNAKDTYSQTAEDDAEPWFMVYVSSEIREFHLILPVEYDLDQAMLYPPSKDVEVGRMHGDENMQTPDNTYELIADLEVVEGSVQTRLSYIVKNPISCEWVVFKSNKPNLKIDDIELFG